MSALNTADMPIRCEAVEAVHSKISFWGGPFDGEVYHEDDRFEKGLWVTDGSRRFWVIGPRKFRRECPVCSTTNPIAQASCAECGAILWRDDPEDETITRLETHVSIVGIEDGEREKELQDRLEEVRQFVDRNGIPAPFLVLKNDKPGLPNLLSIDLQAILQKNGLRAVPEDLRMFHPRDGYYFRIVSPALIENPG